MSDWIEVRREEREQVAMHHEAFGLFDHRGREIGHRWIIQREVWVLDPRNGSSGSVVRAADLEDRLGETFVVCPHALRDGAPFGAIPVRSERRFRTLDEARAYGDACIERARKAAEKKAR